jgi:c-di-GMP-binding flagellar brake protein YcgR
MLKLTNANEPTPRSQPPRKLGSTLRLDRRRSPRTAVSGTATLIRRSHQPDAHRHHICRLTLADISDGGLAALSAIPLEVNEEIDIQITPHGQALHGHVIRCRPARNRSQACGYEVAIQFDPAIAA